MNVYVYERCPGHPGYLLRIEVLGSSSSLGNRQNATFRVTP